MAGIYKLDGIPSDTLSSAVETKRRFKTSSRSSIDEAAVNGKAYSITGDVSIADGDLVAFNVYASCETLIHSMVCDGLDIELHTGLAAGDYSDIKQGSSLNLISNSGSLFYSQKVINPTVLSTDILISGIGKTEVGIVADSTTPFSVSIKNNSGSPYAGRLSVKVESIGGCVDTFGLLSDTQLESNSEMSVYG